jgi:Flp pilus assembly protein TadD
MAREVFNEALMVSPRNASALTNLGNLALLDGDHRAAREFYNRALRENLFLAEPRFNIVLSYQDMGHFEKAMTAYEEYVVMAKTSRWSRLILVAGVFLLLAFLLNR